MLRLWEMLMSGVRDCTFSVFNDSVYRLLMQILCKHACFTLHRKSVVRLHSDITVILNESVRCFDLYLCHLVRCISILIYVRKRDDTCHCVDHLNCLVGYYQQCRFVVSWRCCLEQKCPVRREMYLCTWSVLESYFGAFVLVSGEYRTPISTCTLPYNVLHICISLEPVIVTWKRFYEPGVKQTVAAGDNGEDGSDKLWHNIAVIWQIWNYLHCRDDLMHYAYQQLVADVKIPIWASEWWNPWCGV